MLLLKQEKSNETILHKLKKVDYIGTILFFCSGGFFLALMWGGTIYAWSSWQTILPLSLGAAGLAAFICHQKYYSTTYSILHFALFTKRTANIAFVATIGQGVLLWIVVYYIPLYYEGARHFSPLITGVTLLAETLVIAPAAIMTGLWIARSGRYIWPFFCGWTLTTIGMGLFCLLDVDTPIAVSVVINVVASWGLGMLVPALPIIVQASVIDGEQENAYSLYLQLRTCGQALGVTIGSVIFQNRATHLLSSSKTTSGLALTAEALIQRIQQTSLGAAVREQLERAVAEALKNVWIVSCAIAGAITFATVFVKGYPLKSTVR